MKLRTWIVAGVLLLLVGGTAAGWIRTRESSAPTTLQSEAEKPAPAKATKGKRRISRPLEVDESPLKTAKTLASMPMAAEEQGFAHLAVQVANHEVDLAFADALRRAVDRPPAPTPETKPLFDAKEQAEKTLRTEQDALDALTAVLAKARDSEKEEWEDQVSAQKAQVELAKDELEDAQADLEKAGLDPQASIQRLIDAHHAAEQVEADQEVPLALPFQVQAGSFVARYRAWSLLRRKLDRIEEAERQSLERGPKLEQERAAFSQRIAERRAEREKGKREAAAQGKAEEAPLSAARQRTEDLKRQVRVQRVLTGFTKRAQDERELAQVYGGWADVVAVQSRLALHSLLSKLFWMMLVVAAVFIASLAIDRPGAAEEEEARRGAAMRSVARTAVQVTGLLVIGFLLFGMPDQATTILGLAGAGLTVALKDFIVAFFGWFVLMGKNGIHVGDWVEIKGVGGEVVEIGL
ncbi:MAG TPA: mechanosensitive ion channel domain-containing protein, partial [Holophagaceae bacterium]|nr:mechanosensitive ion channel domain-containing protein [Holophagaceae bacterium]